MEKVWEKENKVDHLYDIDVETDRDEATIDENIFYLYSWSFVCILINILLVMVEKNTFYNFLLYS